MLHNLGILIYSQLAFTVFYFYIYKHFMMNSLLEGNKVAVEAIHMSALWILLIQLHSNEFLQLVCYLLDLHIIFLLFKSARAP